MKIYLSDDKIWRVHPDMLQEKSFSKYIQDIRHFKRIFSEEGILVIENDRIQKMNITDKPIEYGKIIQYNNHNYYHTKDSSEHNDNDNDNDILNEYSVILDKSVIYYDEVYQIPIQHVSENITQYIISMHKKSNVKMILEIMNNHSHDMYFLIPYNMNIQDACNSIVSLIELVKI